MGLFDFVKDFGTKLFADDDDLEVASANIKAAILEDNPGIENLTVVLMEDGTVYLAGNSSSAEALEKAVLIAGNVQNVINVNVEGVTVPAIGDDALLTVEVEYYTIEKGDTLWAIATKFYGNGAKYTKIVEDNLEVIKDADKIYPGQKIRIVKN